MPEWAAIEGEAIENWVMALDETDDIDQPGIDWNKVDWFDLVPRLVLIASHRLKIVGLDTSTISANDIVHDAILKTINGCKGDQKSKMQTGSPGNI